MSGCYATGTVEGSGLTGGFAGASDGKIENSFATATVTGEGSWPAFGGRQRGKCRGACTTDRWPARGTALPRGATRARADRAGRACGRVVLREQAYPQLGCFAQNENEAQALRSKASAIALVLPGQTLQDGIARAQARWS